MSRTVFLLIVPMMLISWRVRGQTPPVFIEEYRFGDFTDAVALDLDQNRNVFVLDAGSHTLSHFTLKGQFVKRIGGQGWDINQFDSPRGLDAHLGIILYVADAHNHRIVRLDKELNPIGVFSTRNNPAQESHFGYPLDVVLSKLGNLFILDGENNRVVSTTGFATVDQSFGGVESGAGRLRHPVALSIDEEDNLYVLETDRVTVFDGFGNYRFNFGNPLFQKARNVSVHSNTCLVVEPDALHLFNLDGTLQRTIKKNDVIFPLKTPEFRDARLFENFLLLLTSENVIVVLVSL